LPYFFDFSLFIKDPVNPQNNVAKSSYKIEAIKQMFSNAYRVLKQYNTSYINEGENIDNTIYDFLINKKYNY
jgi:DNA polymerase sigma